MAALSLNRAMKLATSLLFVVFPILCLTNEFPKVERQPDSGGRHSHHVRKHLPGHILYSNTTTTSNGASTSGAHLTGVSSSVTVLPSVPFGVYVTTIGQGTYTLTYVSTTASTVETTTASNSTTVIIPAGGAVWTVPTLPPGYPVGPSPGLPPDIPSPDGGSGGTDGSCLFGCGGSGETSGGGTLPCVIDCGGGDGVDGGGDNPTQDPITEDPTSTQGPTSTEGSESESPTSTLDPSSTAKSISTEVSLPTQSLSEPSVSASLSAGTTLSSSPPSLTWTTSTASTASTTSSSSSRSYCSYGCGLCNGKRWAAATPSSFAFGPIHEGLSNAAAKHVPLGGDYPGSLGALEIKRQIPGYEDISGLYSSIQALGKSGTTVEVELDKDQLNSYGKGVQDFKVIKFDAADHNLFVDRLTGCTSVVVVSQRGAYMNHLWESPGFAWTGANDVFQQDVIQYLRDTIGAQKEELFSDASTTKIFIMSPAPFANRVREGDMRDTTMDQSLTPDPEYQYRYEDIGNNLDQILPGVPRTFFYYARQENDRKLQWKAYGKAMVVYSNSQTTDPDDPDEDLDHPQSIWRVYMQGKMMGQDLWAANTGTEGAGDCGGGANERRQAGASCTPGASSIASGSISTPASSDFPAPSTNSSISSDVASSSVTLPSESTTTTSAASSMSSSGFSSSAGLTSESPSASSASSLSVSSTTSETTSSASLLSTTTTPSSSVSSSTAITTEPSTTLPSSTEDPTSTTADPAPAPSESCKTTWSALLDTYTIYGKNWDDSKLSSTAGAMDGEGLKSQLKGCSGSAFHFDVLTDDPDGWQFKAHGQTIIGEKSCIGHAITSAGGPSDGCSGSS